jgi:hypothetical protein
MKVLYIMENLKKVKYVEKEDLNGIIKKNILENGKIMKCQDMEIY